MENGKWVENGWQVGGMWLESGWKMGGMGGMNYGEMR